MLQSKIKTEFTRLDNGVRVITERVPHTRSTGISVLVAAGPQDDPDTKSGLAHLCEHALFLGTPMRDRDQISSLIDTAGGQLGAFTAPDYTCFYAHVLEDYASYALDLMGDILVASSFPEALLQREQQVVKQEILQMMDDPNDIALQAIKRSLWPNQSLSRSVTGTAADVATMSRPDVVEFVSKNYTPDRIYVVAAGAVEHDSIVEQTEDALWTLRGHSPGRPACSINPVGGVTVTTKETTQCTFSVAITSPAYVDDQRYALHVLSCLIGGGMSSRLYRSLREQHGLVYSIQSHLLAYRDGGALVIEGVTSPDDVLQAVQLVIHELASLAVWQAPVHEEELWKSRMQVRGQSQLAADLVSNRMSRIATQYFHHGHRIDDDEILAQLDAVTIESLRNVATSILLPGLTHLSIAVVGPVSSGGTVFDELNGLRDCYSAINGG